MKMEAAKPNPETRDYLERLPCFRVLLEKMQDDTGKQMQIEGTNEDEDSKLPEMSKVLKVERSQKLEGSDSPDPRIKAFKNTHRQLRENIKNFLDYYNV
jgi:hypothetical protein